MSTERAFAELVVSLLAPEPVRVKAMFGEYCLYYESKPVAFLCDNRVLLKPTAPAFCDADDLETAQIYPASKWYPVVPDDRLDTPWFREVIVEIASLLPEPKAKKRKRLS